MLFVWCSKWEKWTIRPQCLDSRNGSRVMDKKDCGKYDQETNKVVECYDFLNDEDNSQNFNRSWKVDQRKLAKDLDPGFPFGVVVA